MSAVSAATLEDATLLMPSRFGLGFHAINGQSASFDGRVWKR